VTTGGTIASQYSKASGDVRVSAGGADLVRTARSRNSGIEIELIEFAALASYNMQLDDAVRLAKTIEQALARPDIDGAVVTHGTDTMEESAFVSHLVVSSAKPVVFTGSQIAGGEADSDGPRNIHDALLVAAHPKMRGQGTVVVFDGEIHSASEVTKTHTSRVSTFQSYGWGALGTIDGDVVTVRRKIAQHKGYAPVSASLDGKVDLIKLAMGMDGRFLRCSVEHGVEAIVLEAFGRGNAPMAVLDEVVSICSAGTLVFVASRCPQGRTAPIYGNGGGKDLEAAGAIFLEDLSGIKARILLSVLFGCGYDKKRAAIEVVAYLG
jgi:L-asparaginase